MRIIHGQRVERSFVELGQTHRLHDIPEAVGTGVRGVTFVVNGRMTVIHFKEPLALHAHQVLGSHAPAEIRVVEVRKHRLTGAPMLFEHRIDVVLHDFEHAVAALGRDEVAQVRRVEMDRC